MLPHTETSTLMQHHWRSRELELFSNLTQTNENLGVFMALIHGTLAQADHYQCFKYFIPETRTKHDADIVKSLPQ